jgi:phosphoglycerate dehydrogenase-like enzyme
VLSPTNREDSVNKPVVLAAVDLAPDIRALLEAQSELVVLGSGRLAEASPHHVRSAQAVLTNSKSKVPAEFIGSAPSLRIVATQSIGFDHVDLDAAVHSGVEVIHAPNRREALGSIVMAHMLMLSRNIPQAAEQVRQGLWSKGISGSDLEGKVLFLIGFGGTARAVARKALAFDMDVVAYDVRPPQDVPEGVRLAESLEAGLQQADWVSVHVDLNPKTRHLISARELTLMKETAFLINTSRGPVVDQAALVDALHDGSIAGAGLDVLEVEPPSTDDPILHAPNVLITPHIGFATREIQHDMQECAATAMLARLRGEESEYVLQTTRNGS